MRKPRMKFENRDAVYHCISRIVGGEFLLDDVGKERFRRMMWRQARFAGVQILAYCVMNNHFHILARVPARSRLPDRVLLRRATILYERKPEWLKEALKSLSQGGSIGAGLRSSLLARMGDVSAFMKELKLRFSKWHNKRHQRFGTLWAERFRSLLVENTERYMGLVAAYIDLNPVRAGLVADPKDYRWCGYAEAVAGGKLARRSVKGFVRGSTWAQVAARYRERLFVTAGEPGRSGKSILSREAIRETLAKRGRLSSSEMLRLRIRYMSDGAALGSDAFVEQVFSVFRDRFSEKRRSGARPIRMPGLSNVCVARDLKVDVAG